MNHAVLAVSLYLRSISRAETPFLLAHISKITNSHLRDADLRAVEDRARQHAELTTAGWALAHPAL
jgi:hypothetical protein